VSATGPLPPNSLVFDDAAALAEAAARRLIAIATESAGPVAVSLSGGSTPKLLYRMLADRFAGKLPWSRIHWFFGDDRFVPPDDPDSNLRMVREAMFDRAPVPPENIHPIPTVGVTLDEAASRYAAELRAFYGADSFDPRRPLFALTFLGLGEDGHTASLFPGKPGVENTKDWVVGVPEAGLKPLVPRVSLTLPAIASSGAVLFLVSGAGKRTVLDRIAAGENLPSARVTADPPPVWMLDKAAATGQG
jgi:6-phosphogluconolactonase